MTVASLVVGGVDRPVWRVAAAFSAVGVAAGVAVQGRVLAEEASVLAAGVAVFVVLEVVQDKVMAESEAWWVRGKVVSLGVCLAMLQWMGGEVATAVLVFAIISPHFIVYDATKVLFCFLLLSGERQLSRAGPLQSRAREMLLRLLVHWGSGRSTATLRDPASCEEALTKNARKGKGLERFISLRAWHPITPTESIDGPQWSRQRKAFNRVLASRAHFDLEAAVASRMEEVPKSQVLDSRTMHTVLAKVLHEFVFSQRPSDADAEVWVDASLAFRARIAVKDFGNKKHQEAAVDLTRRLIYATDLNGVLGDLLENDMEKVSVVAQPFILSPLINLSDGIVAAAAMSDSFSSPPSLLSRESAHDFALRALLRYPPFPVFERVLDSPCDGIAAETHVFVFADEVSSRFSSDADRMAHGEWMAFGGSGVRSCPGKHAAMGVLGAVVRGFEGRSVRVAEGHLYSGRINDGRDENPFFFAAMLGAVLVDCVRERLKKNEKI